MKYILIKIFLAVSSFSVEPSNECMDKPLLVEISLRKKQMEEYKDLKFQVKLKSVSDKVIYIPHHISMGFIQDSMAFMQLHLQIKSGNAYIDVEPKGFIDNLSVNKKVDTLSNGREIIYEDYFGAAFRFKKGYYRLRVLCAVSYLNHIKDVYSNWVYFNCKKEIYPSTH